MAHATNGYFAHGYGMKSKGMAGAGVAMAQDGLAAATNPANMVLLGDRLDIGIDVFKPSRGTTTSRGDESGDGKSTFLIPEIGYNKMLGSDMSVGVSIFGNGGMNTQYNTLNENTAGMQTQFGTAGSPVGINLEQLFIAPTFALKLNAVHSVGVTLNLVRQTFSATGLENFQAQGNNGQPARHADGTAVAVGDSGTDVSTGAGFRFGWTAVANDKLSFGASFQPETHMSRFEKYDWLFADRGSMNIPSNYTYGVAFKPAAATTVAFDVQTINYNDLKSVGNIQMQGGSLGDNNGPGFGWKNMTVYKLGFDHKMSDSLVVRGGFSINDQQQIQTSQDQFNVLAPGVVRKHLTLGATMGLSSSSEVTVGYMHAFREDVQGANFNDHMSQNSLGVAYGMKM